MDRYFSFIIPVYNRPNEIEELLRSLAVQTFSKPFEVVVIEDGSTLPSDEVVADFQAKLSITYLQKPNSGPGDSRNYGMRHANGDYFIILDSDCVLPPKYLEIVDRELQRSYVDCYGGPDAAHKSFSLVQKAINYAMTSFLTTGGIRGSKKALGKFQPRSFNMGISHKAFEATGGFGKIHPGEDPDLSIRLWKKGFTTALVPDAFVYHKRRIDWSKFFTQVRKFGTVRPILNKWHPKTAKATYWFPTLFCSGFIIALVLWYLGLILPVLLFVSYFLLIFLDSLVKNKSIAIALLSLLAVVIQFAGYGFGFLKSSLLLALSPKEPQELFPEVFFQ
ncbi:MAG: glycosyltransferase [Maribacter sp.]